MIEFEQTDGTVQILRIKVSQPHTLQKDDLKHELC